jgi:FkbM family methyltransferase
MELNINDIPPTICLNMIVKNESHIIKKTLENLCNKIQFSYWVICDTGSTDNTKEIITDFFNDKDIPGELHNHEWVSFSHNRTIALNEAFNKTDLLFIFDADDEIHGNIKMPETVDNDGYLLNFGTCDGISYQRILLVNNKIKWEYKSVIHEYINCLKPNAKITCLQGDYYVVSGRSGSRNKDPDKYLKDAKILEDAYYEAKQIDDSLYLRYGFYCANSYKDAGKEEEAIKWYKITLDNDNWAQEKYMSCLNLYNLYNNIGEKEKAFYYLVESFHYDTERMECASILIKEYCIKGIYKLAYSYYSIIKDFYENKYLDSDNNNKLFIELDKPNFYLPYYMILVADKIKDKIPDVNQTIQKMYEIIFKKKYHINNDFFIGNLLYNLQFFIQLCVSDNFIQLFQSYIDFLEKTMNINLYKHRFLKVFEKYGLTFQSFEEPKCVFTEEECKKSNKILIYTGFSNLPWNYTYSLNNPLGGSETAVTNLVKSLPNNFEIYVGGEVSEETINNIHFVNLNNLKQLVQTTPFHTIIVSRYIGFYEMFSDISFYKSFIWGHDILLFNYGCNLDVKHILNKWDSKINGCICQTEWHKNLFIDQYPQLKNKMFIINNGIPIDKFIHKPIKVNNRFVYTSCSERGLDRLLELWPSIIEQIPDAKLFICSYNKFPQNEYENKLDTIIKEHESVTHLGRLNREKLYELLSSSEFWLYPTNFNETSCITAMEMLMSEVICIYYPVAGLVNTLGDYGIPVKRDEEISTILNLSKEQKIEIIKRGKIYAQTCAWENRAYEWTKLINTTNKLTQNNNINKFVNEFVKDIVISYGSKDVNKNITEYVLNNLINNGHINIKRNDEYRASLFGDPCFGVKKSIFIKNSEGLILKEYRDNEDVNYPITLSFNPNCIKIINLKRRGDRKKQMIEQLENNYIKDYEFIDAVDGIELKNSLELEALFKGNNFHNRKGVIGCALSHLKIWNKLVNDKNNDYYVILEDDIELCPDFGNKLKEHCFLFQKYDVEHLSLGVYDCNKEEQKKIYTKDIQIFKKDVYKFWNVSFAYIISKKAAKKIIDFVNTCSIKCAIDNPRAYGDILSHYHTTHCIAEQKHLEQFGSDIINQNTFIFNNNNNNNNNAIKISFCDWWHVEYCGGFFDSHNNFITNILQYVMPRENIHVVSSNEEPDILFYSIFGSEHLNYNKNNKNNNIRKIFYSGEPFEPKNDSDYNMTFNETTNNNFRYPLWLSYLNNYLLEECNRRKNGIINVPKRTKFCSFICGGECKTTCRREFVTKLSEYKRVDCGGPFLNNIGYNVPRGINCSGKIEHNLNYKFAIAFENENFPGYVTEKICDVYKSNCIPIYWGNKSVLKDFNPTTFIYANDFANFDELVEYVIKVDNDDELYASYFKEPFLSNMWLDILNDPHKTFYKNLADLILGKHRNLLDTYFDLNSIDHYNKKIAIYNIWHNKLFDHCYEKLDDYSLDKIIMYDVNPKYNKVYNKNKNYNILKEYELTDYNSLYQDTNYCQTSCFCHVFLNNLYKDIDYIGFIQYDMALDANFIYDIENTIHNSYNDTFFYSLIVENKLEVNYICKPYNNSFLEKYNDYFKTNHSFETIKNSQHSYKFICLHTFVIPTKTYVKMMTWFIRIKEWLHNNYLNNLYDSSIAEITEIVFGLFLLLQIIENDNIALKELKLLHEWPSLHNNTEWENYKVRMPEGLSLKDEKRKLYFDIGANIGNWALSNIKNNIKIISVEASPSTYDKLFNNIKQHTNIIPLNYAVCDSPNEYITFYEADSDVLSSLNKEWIHGNHSRFNVKYREILAKTITLDKLIDLYGIPDLIKIDVESAEYYCLRSLSKKVECICFEWASEHLDLNLNCLNYLYKLGYREFFVQINNDEYTFVPSYYYTIIRAKSVLKATTPKYEWGMIWCK